MALLMSSASSLMATYSKHDSNALHKIVMSVWWLEDKHGGKPRDHEFIHLLYDFLSENVILLVCCGCDPFAFDNYLNTPVRLAEEWGYWPLFHASLWYASKISGHSLPSVEDAAISTAVDTYKPCATEKPVSERGGVSHFKTNAKDPKQILSASSRIRLLMQ